MPKKKITKVKEEKIRLPRTDKDFEEERDFIDTIGMYDVVDTVIKDGSIGNTGEI